MISPGSQSTRGTDPKAGTLMRIGVHLVNCHCPDGPESVAPTLAKVGLPPRAFLGTTLYC